MFADWPVAMTGAESLRPPSRDVPIHGDDHALVRYSVHRTATMRFKEGRCLLGLNALCHVLQGSFLNAEVFSIETSTKLHQRDQPSPYGNKSTD